MDNPKVFISYSHESDEFDEWVKSLGEILRENGVDVVLDQWDLHPGQDITTFMENGLSEADRVLVICSKIYLVKANRNKGGVGYEKMIVNADILKDLSTTKYIPIIPPGERNGEVPGFLGARLYIDFREESNFANNIDALVKEIHLGYVNKKPKLGKKPFDVKDQKDEENEVRFNVDWQKGHKDKAFDSMRDMGYETYMEIISYPLNEFTEHSQKEILAAARSSQNHTFGWPIGLVMDSNDYKPRPLADGIYSEIAIDDSSLIHDKSFDYWAISNSGIIYMIKSLFEDMRDPTAIFFNTRIIRNSEILLFCASFYSNLGYDPDSKISISIHYSGLNERSLKSSTVNRYYHPKQTFENEVTTQATTTLNEISNNIVQLTKELTKPLFNVFEFAEFNDTIYEQIINDFINGKVT